MTDQEKRDIINVLEHYKGQIYDKLHDLAAERVQGIDPERLKPANLPETLTLLYMQGVAEALDAVSPKEVIRAVDGDPDRPGGRFKA